MSEYPRISVLTPVWNEAEHIADTLGDLAKQTITDFEVIVIDAGSSDETLDEVRRFEDELDLVIVEHGKPTTPGQLNAGLHKASAPYVARVDGHIRIPPDYLEVVLGHLEAGASAVGVRKLASSEGWFGASLAEVLNSPTGIGGSDYHHETGIREVDHVPYAAYSQAILAKVGDWDERFLANQDAELDHRVKEAGGVILLDGSIHTVWKSKDTVRKAWRQYWRYGRGRAMTARKHRSTLRARHLALPGIATLAPASLVASVAVSPLCLSAAAVHPMACLAMAARHRRALRAPIVRPETAALAFAMLVVQTAWGLSFFKSLVEPGILDSGRLESRIRAKQTKTYA